MLMAISAFPKRGLLREGEEHRNSKTRWTLTKKKTKQKTPTKNKKEEVDWGVGWGCNPPAGRSALPQAALRRALPCAGHVQPAGTGGHRDGSLGVQSAVPGPSMDSAGTGGAPGTTAPHRAIPGRGRPSPRPPAPPRGSTSAQNKERRANTVRPRGRAALPPPPAPSPGGPRWWLIGAAGEGTARPAPAVGAAAGPVPACAMQRQ